MKTIFIFTFLFALIACQDSAMDEMKRRRIERDTALAECISKNSGTSEYLKQLIKETPTKDFKYAIRPRNEKINSNDREIIRACRFEMIEGIRQKHKQK